jgi:proteasome lid subunit RPN8/RPN11
MKISKALLAQIHTHLEDGYPNEACGVMLGANGVVTEVVSADNERTSAPSTGTESARNRYLIDPLAYLKIERVADKRGLAVLGIYHSHPDVAARPSQFDLDHAWPNFSYLIVSVAKGKAAESNSWRLRDDRSAFDQEPVEISD